MNPNRGESYIGSFYWIKSKKATTNLINNKDNECFKCAVIAKTNSFKNKYNWKK